MHSSKSSLSATPTVSVDTPASSQHTKQYRLKQTLISWLQLDSFGGRLFWMIMVGALTGIGGMAFLFSEMIKYQAEDQVRSTLDGKVNEIASVTEAAETLAYGLGVSATTLHERGAQYADTYRELTRQLFEGRPEFVIGLGVGQRENGLIANQTWLFPYYWVNSSAIELSDNDAAIQYEDFADNQGEFYPDSDRYQQYFVPREEVWTDPYQGQETHLLTYYLPLFTKNDQWVGTTLVDIDGQYLSELLNDPVFRGMGNFMLITRSGKVIANPANPESNLNTYEEIPDLKDFWLQVDFTDSGFFEGETGYWSYAKVPGQDWFVFGFVPYPAVFNQITLITVLATILMVALLSTAIFLAVRRLNRYLRPVLNQCNQLAKTDKVLLAKWDQQDELKHLSFAFFNMVEKLNLNEETIRRHEQKIEKKTFHADQVSAQFTEFIDLSSQQASEQQDLVLQVQRLTTTLSTNTQSLNYQLDALNTLGRALSSELSRTASDTYTAEIWVSLEQQLQQLIKCWETEDNPQSAKQVQVLMDHLLKTITKLKANEDKRPSLDSLWEQTKNIAQTRQAAIMDARSIDTAVQSMSQLATKIEKLAKVMMGRSQSITDD